MIKFHVVKDQQESSCVGVNTRCSRQILWVGFESRLTNPVLPDRVRFNLSINSEKLFYYGEVLSHNQTSKKVIL